MRSNGLKFARRPGFVVLIALLPVAIIAIAEVEHLRSPVGQPVNGGVFDGRLPGIGQARFDVFFDGSNATAWLYREGAGNSDWVSLKFQPSGIIHGDLVTGDGGWATNGTMDFRIAQATGRLEGTISLISNSPPHPFALARVYEHRTVRRQTGRVLGRFGESQDFTGQFPVLTAGATFQTELSKRMVAETTAAAAKYSARDWHEVWYELRNWQTPLPFSFHTGQYWQVRLMTDSLASFAVYTCPEAQAGNHTFWTGHNYIWQAGKLREFELADMFRPGTDWQAQIRRLCSEELRRQGSDPKSALARAQTLLDQKVNSRIFTLSPTGIQIYYNPHEIDCGAAGAFIVHLLYARLQPFLQTNGPAAHLTHLAASR